MFFRDLEDAVCHVSAESVGGAFIVTRNIRDFRAGTVLAVLPEVFTQHLSEGVGDV